MSAFSPLPEGRLREFLRGLSAVLVLEEQMPFLERGIGGLVLTWFSLGRWCFAPDALMRAPTLR